MLDEVVKGFKMQLTRRLSVRVGVSALVLVFLSPVLVAQDQEQGSAEQSLPYIYTDWKHYTTDDGLPNEQDACDDTPLGADVNPSGGPMGDFDDDCDVDLSDHFAFSVCLWLSGPGAEPLFQECLGDFDFDGDEDVDLMDFAVFQAAFTGG